jgi:hypothetical protein
MEPFRYIRYKGTERLFEIIIITITNKYTGITSKYYNTGNFTGCYGKIINLCVKKHKT